MTIDPNPALAPFVDALLALDLPSHSPEKCITLVEPLVAAWAARSDEWIMPHYKQCPATEENHVIYLGDDGHLFVDVITWQPAADSAIHDHRTWAVLACVQGCEKNTLWKRLDDGSRDGYADVEKVDSRYCVPGDVLSMLPDDIHSVSNGAEDGGLAISLHVYGFDLTRTGRQKYNRDTHTVQLMPTLQA